MKEKNEMMPKTRELLRTMLKGTATMLNGPMGSWRILFDDRSGEVSVFLSASHGGRVQQPRFPVGLKYIGKNIKEVVSDAQDYLLIHFHFQQDGSVRFLSAKLGEIPICRVVWDAPGRTSRVVVSYTKAEMGMSLRDVTKGKPSPFIPEASLPNLVDTLKANLKEIQE